MKSPIAWPASWPPTEGWPTQMHGHAPLTKEPRLWASLAAGMVRLQTRLQDRVVALGGPAGDNMKRTLHSVEKLILTYCDVHGRRPTRRLDHDWGRINAWLGGRGSSLSKLCDELKLPVGRVTARTLESVTRDVLEYHKTTGERPVKKLNRKWANDAVWLIKQGTTLPKLCDELGLRPATRTAEKIESEVLSYAAAHDGQRPTAQTSPKWLADDAWLQTRNTSLSKLCKGLKIHRRASRHSPELIRAALCGVVEAS